MSHISSNTLTNLFSDIPEKLPKELFTTLLEAPSIRVERIASQGHVTPPEDWYDQDQHEWVMLLKGAARLKFENRSIEMRPGDFVNIPAYEKHRVEWTTCDEPTIWLAIHYGDLS